MGKQIDISRTQGSAYDLNNITSVMVDTDDPDAVYESRSKLLTPQYMYIYPFSSDGRTSIDMIEDDILILESSRDANVYCYLTEYEIAGDYVKWSAYLYDTSIKAATIFSDYPDGTLIDEDFLKMEMVRGGYANNFYAGARQYGIGSTQDLWQYTHAFVMNVPVDVPHAYGIFIKAEHQLDYEDGWFGRTNAPGGYYEARVPPKMATT